MTVRIIPGLDKIRKDLANTKTKKLLDFQIGTISGNLRAIIAAEDMEFKSGDIKSIEIQKIPIPANYVCFLSGYGSNSYGHTLAVNEDIPLPLSMDREAIHSMFAAAQNCEIKKDDLLGVLILLPVELKY